MLFVVRPSKATVLGPSESLLARSECKATIPALGVGREEEIQSEREVENVENTDYFFFSTVKKKN